MDFFSAPDQSGHSGTAWLSEVHAVFAIDVLLWLLVVVLIVCLIFKCRLDSSEHELSRMPSSIYRREVKDAREVFERKIS
ncbi:hypothetical protein AAVH_14187, partial [Aphelenchoides avenae]